MLGYVRYIQLIIHYTNTRTQSKHNFILYTLIMSIIIIDNTYIVHGYAINTINANTLELNTSFGCFI